MQKMKLNLKRIISIDTLDKKTIEAIFSRASYFLNEFIDAKKQDTSANGKVVSLLFYEPSTRTQNSFSIAAQRLGAITVEPTMSFSSASKGETLLDTIKTFEAMGTDLFVVRHTDNNVVQFIASELANSKIGVINAGDGSNEHPSQCLLDLFTMSQQQKSFSDLTVAIIGDVAHSRVARSLVKGLRIMGIKEVRLIAPNDFLPNDYQHWNCKVTDVLADGLQGVDIIYSLRIQKERIEASQLPNLETFKKKFCLTPSTLKFAKENALIMHPGPINRNVEIDSAVADGKQSLILPQVRNGVAIRMALIDMLLTK